MDEVKEPGIGRWCSGADSEKSGHMNLELHVVLRLLLQSEETKTISTSSSCLLHKFHWPGWGHMHTPRGNHEITMIALVISQCHTPSLALPLPPSHEGSVNKEEDKMATRSKSTEPAIFLYHFQTAK
ncbi:uncharacterized protein LOC143654020 isoform X2 [Tamandua tetradactyla]|uniref:uncharacterized protein LOC143654020 isoform X2 n=1 Tax=Tamandua tetradactyla TaxID=48850 RepID=UPI004054541B